MSEFLHIGDLITLYDDTADGYLGGQGISSTAVGVRLAKDENHAKQVRSEAVFQLRQQQNYSATRQYRALLEREGLTIADAAGESRFDDLRDAIAREAAANQQEYINTRGREVQYGMIVQLLHDTSHRYACVTRQSAELNVDGRKVALEAEAGETAWVRVMPRLRVHSEGEKVHVGDPVTLEHVATNLKLSVDLRPMARLECCI